MDTTPGIILVRPQLGENIGAAARAMLNFGLMHMRIVAPRDGWPNPAAKAMAAGAGRVLDAAEVMADLDAALAGYHLVLATTARPRGLAKDVLSPEAAMQLAAETIRAGQRVGVMFGPERAGLENDDIARATAIVTVPVNPDYPSLNLAQCVLLLGYEWRRATTEVIPREAVLAGSVPATADEVAHLAGRYEEMLGRSGFFFPLDKAQAMKTNLRNMWHRLPLTQQDVRTLQGALRQLVRRPPKGD